MRYRHTKKDRRNKDPVLGRFAQADTLVPEPGNPQAWDRYAYSYGNPVKYIDPDGHCPTPPPGWGPAICVALFIAPPEIKAGPFRLHGDDRGFGPNSDPSASRGYLWVSPDGAKYESHLNPSGYIFPAAIVDIDTTIWAAPSSENSWTVTSSGNGYISISYDLVVSGILDSSGAAPHINGTIDFRVNGNGSIDYAFDRDGFPWAEAYYYNGQGGFETIFQDPAVRGNPYDLFAIEPNPKPLARITRAIQGYGVGDPFIRSQNNLCRLGEPC